MTTHPLRRTVAGIENPCRVETGAEGDAEESLYGAARRQSRENWDYFHDRGPLSIRTCEEVLSSSIMCRQGNLSRVRMHSIRACVVGGKAAGKGYFAAVISKVRTLWPFSSHLWGTSLRQSKFQCYTPVSFTPLLAKYVQVESCGLQVPRSGLHFCHDAGWIFL